MVAKACDCSGRRGTSGEVFVSSSSASWLTEWGVLCREYRAREAQEAGDCSDVAHLKRLVTKVKEPSDHMVHLLH